MKIVHCVWFVTGAAQHNPPTWPSTVRVFDPEDSDIQQVVNAAFKTNGGFVPENNGQFSEDRYAFLFKPGNYTVDVPVGYYTQVAGLGKKPSDVQFVSGKGPYSDEGSHTLAGGALDTFWRSAENFETSAKTMLWAVSQAAPLRRVIVNHDLNLFAVNNNDAPNYPADFASGGFMANSIVRGKVESASQQQWMMRNADVKIWDGGVYNMVFVGTQGAPAFHCGNAAAETGKGPYGNGKSTNPHVTVESTPTIAEKPFISISESGLYSLNIPQVASDRIGVDFDAGVQVEFDQVFVANAASDTATTINAALTSGLHVVLSPGIYKLDSSLEINQKDQVILGLGLATLIAAKGQPAIKVGDVDGARVAGVLLQAGHVETDTLLQWGSDPSTHPGNAANPGLLHDVFARVGGPAAATDTQVDVMLKINSGNVIGDNLWLWRADHVEGGALVKGGQNPCLNGLVVNGDDVTMYALAAEHTLQDLVKWNGERGATYFYQSELPYDVTQEDYGDKGYAGYRVAQGVTSHVAYGVGVYHFFRDFSVTVASGIVAPPMLEDSFIAPLSVYLNGNGNMLHVINDKGAANPALTEQGQKIKGAIWICPDDPSPTSDPSPTQAPPPSPSTTPLVVVTTPVPTTPAPSPHGSCNVGETVMCSSGGYCAGDQCCQDNSICPSADSSFKSCGINQKAYDCTTAMFVVV